MLLGIDPLVLTCLVLQVKEKTPPVEEETEKMRAELLKKEAELIKLKQLQLDMEIQKAKKELQGQVSNNTILYSVNSDNIVTNIEIKKSCIFPVVIFLTHISTHVREVSKSNVLGEGVYP